MARPREFDIDTALDAAMGVFWDKGFEATSMADLMAAMGLQKGSIYKAFADKHDLFMQVLDRYLGQMGEALRQQVESYASPRQGIRAVLRSGGRVEGTGEGPSGCMAVNTLVELGPHDGGVAQRLKRHQQEMTGFFTQVIERGQELGEIRRDIPAGQLAQTLMVFAAGTMSLCRGLLSPGEREEAADAAVEVIL
ncbi:MAG: TetR family transcriptional regulator [Candidatus Latescibacteria bacterium]|nr:TetR family transcriptional regulator [Candidatus Latescibacterota bacterium]